MAHKRPRVEIQVHSGVEYLLSQEQMAQEVAQGRSSLKSPNHKQARQEAQPSVQRGLYASLSEPSSVILFSSSSGHSQSAVDQSVGSWQSPGWIKGSTAIAGTMESGRVVASAASVRVNASAFPSSVHRTGRITGTKPVTQCCFCRHMFVLALGVLTASSSALHPGGGGQGSPPEPTRGNHEFSGSWLSFKSTKSHPGEF